MPIFFVNHCRAVINIVEYIENHTAITHILQPNNALSLPSVKQLTISSVTESYLLKSFLKPDTFCIYLQSRFEINPLPDNTLFHITMEKQQIEENAYYFRFKLQAVDYKHKVINKEQLHVSGARNIHAYVRKIKIYDFLFFPLLNSLPLLLIGLPLGLLWSWRVYGYFCLGAYLAMMAVDWLSQRLANTFIKKICKHKYLPRDNIDKYLSNEYANNFFGVENNIKSEAVQL